MFGFIGLRVGRCGSACALLSLGVAGLALALSGCGSSEKDGAPRDGEGGAGGEDGGSGGTTPTGPVPETEFAIKYAAAICDNVERCCQRAGFGPAREECRADTANALAAGYAAFRKNLEYDPVSAGRCIAELATLVKACDAETSDKASSCRSAYQGKLVLGTACTNGAECAAPAGESVACVSRICQLTTPTPTRTAKRGEPCGLTACEAGLVCGSTQTCEEKPGEGEPCGTGCRDGLACGEYDGLCHAGATSGLCPGGFSCASGTHYCDVDCSVTCQALQADGKFCTDDKQCASGACYPSGCNEPLFGVRSLCTLPVPKDDPRECAVSADPSGDFEWSTLIGAPFDGQIWGSAADDVFAISRGKLVHSLGDEVWVAEPIAGAQTASAVWGRAADDVYVGTNVGLFHGTSGGPWTLVSEVGPVSISDVSGNADTVYAASGAKVLARDAEGTWTNTGFIDANSVSDLWASDDGFLYLLSYATAYRFDPKMGWGRYALSENLSLFGYGVDWFVGGTSRLYKITGEGGLGRVQIALGPSEDLVAGQVIDEQTTFVATQNQRADINGALNGSIYAGDGDATWTRIGVFRQPRTIWAPSANELYVGHADGVSRGLRR